MADHSARPNNPMNKHALPAFLVLAFTLDETGRVGRKVKKLLPSRTFQTTAGKENICSIQLNPVRSSYWEMSFYAGGKTSTGMQDTARHETTTTAGHTTKARHNSWNEICGSGIIMDKHPHKNGLCLDIASLCFQNHLLNQRLGGRHEVMKLAHKLHTLTQASLGYRYGIKSVNDLSSCFHMFPRFRTH